MSLENYVSVDVDIGGHRGVYDEDGGCLTTDPLRCNALSKLMERLLVSPSCCPWHLPTPISLTLTPSETTMMIIMMLTSSDTLTPPSLLIIIVLTHSPLSKMLTRGFCVMQRCSIHST
ncbi:hypothetical protein MUK42_10581 [Musa troglodytarum]|uniref:Uncharacterized protein n=1 Tax=Musa troglodytarum TaxID=320322 RepID=A0A9E7KJ26_9LILI|nr:hypothetical protein MUK42_10581 [Musa troglodytarum]